MLSTSQDLVKFYTVQQINQIKTDQLIWMKQRLIKKKNNVILNVYSFVSRVWLKTASDYEASVLEILKVLYSHEQLYIHICMQKHIQHNKDERTQFFRKIYLSLFSKVRKGYERFYCVRGELETEQNCNILTPTRLAITAFLSRSPGPLNWGPGGPVSDGTCFSFQHLISNWSELPVAGVLQ